jgi:hypothetical protein
LNKWFVIHDLLSYNQHKELIGNIVKAQGVEQPKSSAFANIKKGDIVVYYASKDYVITGIFEVTSDLEYREADPQWKEIMIYKIKPLEMPKEGEYLDFKKLVKDIKIRFDLFPDKSKWGSYLQGKTSVLLTDRDYLTIKNALTKKVYFKKIDDIKVGSTKSYKNNRSKTVEVTTKNTSRHQLSIDKWKTEEENRFGGMLKPTIETNVVDLNDILPKDIWLNKNKKYLDAISRLEMGGQPFYQSVLEVQHKGSKEDLCVRVSIVLPFVTRVDIVSDEEVLDQIKELLERVADPHVVKTRVKFYSFESFLADKPRPTIITQGFFLNTDKT